MSAPIPFPTRLLREQVEFAALVWVGFTIFVFGVTLGVSFFREIEFSGWDMASQAVRWYALVIGVHLGWSELALHVTHGQTRRAFMGQAAIFVPLFAAALAAMSTITAALELGYYGLAGWTHAIGEGQLAGSGLDVLPLFVQSWLIVMLWTAGGLFMAVWFYRSDWLGAAAIPIAIFLSGLSGMAFSGDWGPMGRLYEWLFGARFISPPLGIGLHIAMVAGLLGLTWLAMRDVAIRPKSE